MNNVVSLDGQPVPVADSFVLVEIAKRLDRFSEVLGSLERRALQ